MRTLMLALVFALCAGSAFAEPQVKPRQTPNADNLYVIDHYDRLHNSAEDLRQAEARAQAEHKRILLEVGGDWCSWCDLLDHFLAEHSDVRAAFRESFVVLKIDMSADHMNDVFLSHYPTLAAFPAFIVLDSDGRFLRAQNTEPFEQGRGYNPQRLIAFANAWRRNDQ